MIPALSGYQKQLRRPEGHRYKGNPGGGGERDSKEYARDLPRVSILFSALDEAEKLPAALATFLAQDYPDYEVIAVDDRSEDATGSILDAAARAEFTPESGARNFPSRGLAGQTARIANGV